MNNSDRCCMLNKYIIKKMMLGILTFIISVFNGLKKIYYCVINLIVSIILQSKLNKFAISLANIFQYLLDSKFRIFGFSFLLKVAIFFQLKDANKDIFLHWIFISDLLLLISIQIIYNLLLVECLKLQETDMIFYFKEKSLKDKTYLYSWGTFFINGLVNTICYICKNYDSTFYKFVLSELEQFNKLNDLDGQIYTVFGVSIAVVTIFVTVLVYLYDRLDNKKYGISFSQIINELYPAFINDYMVAMKNTFFFFEVVLVIALLLKGSYIAVASFTILSLIFTHTFFLYDQFTSKRLMIGNIKKVIKGDVDNLNYIANKLAANEYDEYKSFEDLVSKHDFYQSYLRGLLWKQKNNYLDITSESPQDLFQYVYLLSNEDASIADYKFDQLYNDFEKILSNNPKELSSKQLTILGNLQEYYWNIMIDSFVNMFYSNNKITYLVRMNELQKIVNYTADNEKVKDEYISNTKYYIRKEENEGINEDYNEFLKGLINSESYFNSIKYLIQNKGCLFKEKLTQRIKMEINRTKDTQLMVHKKNEELIKEDIQNIKLMLRLLNSDTFKLIGFSNLSINDSEEFMYEDYTIMLIDFFRSFISNEKEKKSVIKETFITDLLASNSLLLVMIFNRLQIKKVDNSDEFTFKIHYYSTQAVLNGYLKQLKGSDILLERIIKRILDTMFQQKDGLTMKWIGIFAGITAVLLKHIDKCEDIFESLVFKEYFNALNEHTEASVIEGFIIFAIMLFYETKKYNKKTNSLKLNNDFNNLYSFLINPEGNIDNQQRDIIRKQLIPEYIDKMIQIIEYLSFDDEYTLYEHVGTIERNLRRWIEEKEGNIDEI